MVDAENKLKEKETLCDVSEGAAGKGVDMPVSFEAGLCELDSIMSSMDDPNVGLDQQISLYERGVKIHAFCEKYLKEARLKVEKLVHAADDEDLKESKTQAYDVQANKLI